MKIALKIIICSVILLLFNTRTQAQSIVEIDGDTLVLITRENVNTINSIITEREYLMAVLNENGIDLTFDSDRITYITEQVSE